MQDGDIESKATQDIDNSSKNNYKKTSKQKPKATKASKALKYKRVTVINNKGTELASIIMKPNTTPLKAMSATDNTNKLRIVKVLNNDKVALTVIETQILLQRYPKYIRAS